MRCALLAAALLSAALPLAAQAGLLVPAGTGRPDAAVLALRDMEVDVGVARGYARVNVRQVFENRTGAVQEGSYRFALPPSAAVGDFAIWDGLQRIPGVILERRRARSIYQELARQAIDPGLLQQGEEEAAPGPGGPRPSAGSLFSATVSPIPPYATKRVELQFQEEVPWTGGSAEFRLVLRPADGEPPVAGHFKVQVALADADLEPGGAGLPLQPAAGGAAFEGQNVRLDQDLVIRLRPRGLEPLRLSAFRNPEGTLPDGLALAPWERPAEIPPEKDGFFLLEAMPPQAAQAAVAAAAAPAAARPSRPAQSLAILFDTSLAQRWGGLETAYGYLVRVLQALGDADRFALIPFDRVPQPAALRPATAPAVADALSALRARPLGPPARLAAALAEARKTLGGSGRILVLTGGQGGDRPGDLKAAAGPVPVFTAVTGQEADRGLAAVSAQMLSPAATDLEGDLFFRRLLAPAEPGPAQAPAAGRKPPFTVSGGDPKLRDIYPVLLQPLAPGSLSGWIGRYGAPAARLRFDLASPLFPGGRQSLQADLPERALDARDLPRRWAKARVDDLLARMDSEGEKREWVDEVIALSKRYKFVTPYTAFLAAPRALLRPRRIQPGDPVLRVTCDPGTVAATALLPFGLRLELVRQPDSNVWEGRFLVPEGLKDGRYPLRVLVRDASGAQVSETKYFILDGKTPDIRPLLPASCRAGEPVRVAAMADEDVVLLTARLGDAPPVPLRWDPAERRCVGLLPVPADAAGRREVLFEAVDAAKNRGFARAELEVRP